MNEIYFGDCRASLRKMAAAGVKVQTCVTSPPYFGLRDYGVDGQIGLEETPEQFIAGLVEVFRCVRDVLADDGTMWVNIGDSYNSGSQHNAGKGGKKERHGLSPENGWAGHRPLVDGLKNKDLIGIPWMLAFALRADGWYLRQDIIWHKPNPMPESVADRCTKAHEYMFLLSKAPRYFYDADAIKEPASGIDTRPQQVRAKQLAELHGLTDEHKAAIRSCGATDAGKAQVTQDGHGKNTARVQRLAGDAKAALGGYYREFLMAETRNRRSVWTIATRPYKGAHFATFPPALVEPCILAGSRPGDIVLDPFMGSGTTAAVALQHGRQYIGCELNEAYKPLQDERIAAARSAADEAQAVIELAARQMTIFDSEVCNGPRS